MIDKNDILKMLDKIIDECVPDANRNINKAIDRGISSLQGEIEENVFKDRLGRVVKAQAYYYGLLTIWEMVDDEVYDTSFRGKLDCSAVTLIKGE